MQTWKRTSIIVAAATLLATAALAHDTWLLPRTFRAPARVRVEMELTSGMAFPKNETAIDPERIERSGMRLGADTVPLTIGARGKDSLRLAATPLADGIATLWVELRPRTLELTPAQVEEYLAEIGAPPEVRKRYEAMPAPRRWRETYRKHAKTFVRVGETAGDPLWRFPVGLGFELVPQADPTALRAGQQLGVTLLRGGKPAAAMSISLVREGSAEAIARTTDAAGNAEFPLAKAGRYLLRATDLRAADGKEVDWESDFTTLTVMVQ